MRLVQVDTLRLGEFPNILFVLVHTDEGLVGLGETFFGRTGWASSGTGSPRTSPTGLPSPRTVATFT